jgi:hypothetical protein
MVDPFFEVVGQSFDGAEEHSKGKAHRSGDTVRLGGRDGYS